MSTELKGVHVRLSDEEHEAFKKLSEKDGAAIAWHLRAAAINYLRVKGIRVKPSTLQRGRKGGE